MGVPRLLYHLQPHAGRAPLNGATVVIDGPALAYHIVGLCQKEAAGRSHPLDHVAYGQLGQRAVAWLDELCRHQITLRALYFDGYLPQSKRPVRLDRVYHTSTQLKNIFESYQHGIIPGFDATGPGPVPPAFIVPAVLDALWQSAVYGPLTHLVPGEADTFCAQEVHSGGAGTVLTSDSDLLVQDLGPGATVVFFRDIDLPSTESAGPLQVPMYSRAAICKRLGLRSEDGMISFAFELSMDPHQNLGELVIQANQGNAVSSYPKEYAQFSSAYASPGALAVSASKFNLDALDPRVSEFALQCLLPLSQADKQASKVFVYLPQLLESWARSNAWDASASLRQLAFSSLQVAAGRTSATHIFEFVRVTTLSSSGSRLELLTPAQTRGALADIEGLIQQIRARVAHPILQWIVLSAYQEMVWSRCQAKESVFLAALSEASADGILGRVTWNALHWLAHVQGTLYSLRILQQLLGFVGELDGTLLPKGAELHRLLSSVPPIAAWPTLQAMRTLPARLKEAGALTLLAELARLPSPISFQPETKAAKKMRSSKNRRNKDRNKNETPAANGAVRKQGVKRTKNRGLSAPDAGSAPRRNPFAVLDGVE